VGTPDPDAPHLVEETQYTVTFVQKVLDRDDRASQLETRSGAKVDADFMAAMDGGQVPGARSTVSAKAILEATAAKEVAPAAAGYGFSLGVLLVGVCVCVHVCMCVCV
jgi:hypothetical protein